MVADNSNWTDRYKHSRLLISMRSTNIDSWTVRTTTRPNPPRIICGFTSISPGGNTIPSLTEVPAEPITDAMNELLPGEL